MGLFVGRGVRRRDARREQDPGLIVVKGTGAGRGRYFMFHG